MTERLASVLGQLIEAHGGAAIAVSGGVDSMPLSSFAHRNVGRGSVRMIHAISPAVPAAATERVRELAAAENWQLAIVDAGEFADERYRANPVNRCFFCKSNLYQSLGAMTDGIVLSGTNMDDLGDYRPGLEAADDHGVRHPYVEAGMAKSQVRDLARALDLPDMAKLPAAPCLASRVETGMRITAPDLLLIDQVETWLRHSHAPGTVRCRLRPGRLVIELDEATLETMTARQQAELARVLPQHFPEARGRAVEIAAYRRGSAFIHPDQAPLTRPT